MHAVALSMGRAMTKVVGTADGTAQNGVATIGTDATERRIELDRVLSAARLDAGERRRHQRVLGRGAVVTVRTKHGLEGTVLLRDLSPSGAALAGDWELPPGDELDLELPNNGGTVSGRVVRCKGGFLVVVFQQDQASKDRVGLTMELLAVHSAAA